MISVTRKAVAHLVAAAGLLAATSNGQGAELPRGDCRKPAAATDLSGCDLTGAKLAGRNLRGARFVGAKLENADLRKSSLEDADFREANAKWANFTGARRAGHGRRRGHRVG